MSTSPRDPQSDRPKDSQGSKIGASIKAPLIFSAVLGVIGGGIAAVTATGGIDKPLRVDIGLLFFGIFFIVSLVLVAMLQLAAKDNPKHISTGSGINRSSEAMHREAMARQREKQRQQREEAEAQEDQDATQDGDKAEKSEENPDDGADSQ